MISCGWGPSPRTRRQTALTEQTESLRVCANHAFYLPVREATLHNSKPDESPRQSQYQACAECATHILLAASSSSASMLSKCAGTSGSEYYSHAARMRCYPPCKSSGAHEPQNKVRGESRCHPVPQGSAGCAPIPARLRAHPRDLATEIVRPR